MKYYPSDWYNGDALSRHVFGRCSIQILAGAGNPDYGLSYFSSSPSDIYRDLPILSHDSFLTNPFQLINHPITRHCLVSILIGSINNQQQEEKRINRIEDCEIKAPVPEGVCVASLLYSFPRGQETQWISAIVGRRSQEKGPPCSL
jgi:hypothetical protein